MLNPGVEGNRTAGRLTMGRRYRPIVAGQAQAGLKPGSSRAQACPTTAYAEGECASPTLWTSPSRSSPRMDTPIRTSWLLRSQRDHNGTQYLQYDYGLVSYMDTMSFLEQGVGKGVKVDAFLLQACGISSARKSQAHVEKLASCLEKRRAR